MDFWKILLIMMNVRMINGILYLPRSPIDVSVIISSTVRMCMPSNVPPRFRCNANYHNLKTS